MKTKAQKKLIREYVRHPFFWMVLGEYERYLLIMNWVTGEFHYCHKQKEDKKHE